MDPLYTVELFGGLRVVAHFDQAGDNSTRSVTRFRTQQTGSMLAYLALSAGRALSREVIIDMFWPDASLKSGRSRLSMALSSLRNQLEPPGVAPGSVLISDQHRIGLSRLVTTDTARFESLIDAAERPSSDRASRKSLFEAALKLFNREIAPGHYDTWIVEEQVRLADRARKALLYLARTAEIEGDIDLATAYARRAASDSDGLCEEAEDILDRLCSGGKRKPANADLKRFASVSSHGETRIPGRMDMHVCDRQSDPPPITSEPAITATVSDFVAPPALPVPLTRFFGRETELRALENAVRDPRTRLISLTGAGGSGKTRLVREAVLQWRYAASVCSLEDERCSPRLPHAGEIISIDLTSESDAFRIPVRLAAALDIPASELNIYEITRDDSDLAVFVRAFAHRRSPVIILDNMEQLLPRGASWVAALLERVPHLTCIVTSRVRLRTPGEFEIPVLPLSSPPPGCIPKLNASCSGEGAGSSYGVADLQCGLAGLLREWPSVALFVDRAQASRPGFSLTSRNAADIVALVRELEGLPLSIELAAARAQVMTPAQMLRQLHDDRFKLLTARGSHATGRRRREGRHTSLKETVAWSVSLLPEDVQKFYGQMSVFRGGWDDEAAEAVSENPMALDALAVLCDASLVRAEPTTVNDDEIFRFDMLESLREFAATSLNQAPADCIEDESEQEHPEYAAAAKRHAEFFSEVVAESAPYLQHADGKHYLADLGRDNDNITAALTWLTVQPEGQFTLSALTLGGDLGPYWARTGRLHEGRDLLTALVSPSVRKAYRALPPGELAPKLAKAVNSLGVLAMQQRDFRDARRWFRTALFLERNEAKRIRGLSRGDPLRQQYQRRRASVLNNFAIVKRNLNDLPGAVRAYKDSLALWREIGEMRFVSTVLSNMGAISAKCRDFDSADRYYREAIKIARTSKNPHTEACAFNNLAELSYESGRLTEADGLYRQSLRIFHAQKEITSTAKIVFQLALIQLRQDAARDRALGMLGAAWRVLADEGVSLSDADNASASALAGASWTHSAEQAGDSRLALESFITALLSENRFASAPAVTQRTLAATDAART